MSYRDDHEAMRLHLAALQEENQRLQEAMSEALERIRGYRRQLLQERKAAGKSGCLLCGGTLLPVAVFAGHDTRSPLPLNMSTMRFGDPKGGFTHSAPIHAKACSSCGFIHSFIDLPELSEDEQTAAGSSVELPIPDLSDEPEPPSNTGPQDGRHDDGAGPSGGSSDGNGGSQSTGS